MKDNKEQIALLQQTVYKYYSEHGRALPWRETTDPYAIWVSEVMLQQTQVDRVIPKYTAWMERFPSVDVLADASLAEVLRYWSGLGYNRRAKYIHEAAGIVAREYGHVFPAQERKLLELPGIGDYTAAAIQAFAFNKPVILFETNVRTVFIHWFFADEDMVNDRTLEPLVKKALDIHYPRKWYNALMDYGTHLKSVTQNPTQKSYTYTKQSLFEGSDRQIRGAVIKHLISNKNQSKTELITQLQFDEDRINPILDTLVAEGFLAVDDDLYSLRE